MATLLAHIAVFVLGTSHHFVKECALHSVDLLSILGDTCIGYCSHFAGLRAAPLYRRTLVSTSRRGEAFVRTALPMSRRGHTTLSARSRTQASGKFCRTDACTYFEGDSIFHGNASLSYYVDFSYDSWYVVLRKECFALLYRRAVRVLCTFDDFPIDVLCVCFVMSYTATHLLMVSLTASLLSS